MQFILQIISLIPLLAAAAVAAPAPTYGNYDCYDRYPTQYDGNNRYGRDDVHVPSRHYPSPSAEAGSAPGGATGGAGQGESRGEHCGCHHPPHHHHHRCDRCPVRFDAGSHFNGHVSEERCEDEHSFFEVDRPCRCERCDRLAKRDVTALGTTATGGPDAYSEGTERPAHVHSGGWYHDPRSPYGSRYQFGGPGGPGGPYGCEPCYGAAPYDYVHPRGVRYGYYPLQE